jgi:hypothetical protein
VGFTWHVRACNACKHDGLSITPTGLFRRAAVGEIFGGTCMMHESVSGAGACIL